MNKGFLALSSCVRASLRARHVTFALLTKPVPRANSHARKESKGKPRPASLPATTQLLFEGKTGRACMKGLRADKTD